MTWSGRNESTPQLNANSVTANAAKTFLLEEHRKKQNAEEVEPFMVSKVRFIKHHIIDVIVEFCVFFLLQTFFIINANQINHYTKMMKLLFMYPVLQLWFCHKKKAKCEEDEGTAKSFYLLLAQKSMKKFSSGSRAQHKTPTSSRYRDGWTNCITNAFLVEHTYKQLDEDEQKRISRGAEVWHWRVWNFSKCVWYTTRI